MIDTVLHWVVPLPLLAVFLLCAWTNYDNLFEFTRHTRERRIPPGGRVSPAMFVGGISGAIAFALWPAPDLKWFIWVPFLIDLPGTLGIGRGADDIAPDAQTQEGRATAGEAARMEDARMRAEREARERRARELERALVGCLLGTAVGDALGLPFEGLGPRRRKKLYPDGARYYLLPFARGMCSDDTEHTVMVAQSVLEHWGQAEDDTHARAVTRSFARRLRFWLLGLPAGIGLATLRAIAKLWIFIPARWSGVYSAGNAPSMRSALLGIVYAEQPGRLRAVLRALTRITHTDPRAEQAALTVAVAAGYAAAHRDRGTVEEFIAQCKAASDGDAAEWLSLLDRIGASLKRGESTPEFATTLGLVNGVTGYSFHTVPIAVHAWLSHRGDFRETVLAAIECGGDTDTVAAIAGAIAGAGAGKEGIPSVWLERLVEWPRTPAWLQQLGERLAGAVSSETPRSGPLPGVGPVKLFVRNLFFLGVVLTHGFRRLLPPY